MSARWTHALALVLAIGGSAAIAATASSLGDYPRDGARAVDGLAAGDVGAFLTNQPVMGTLSVLVRAPVVALVQAVDGGVLWSYRAGAFVCVLAVGALGVALAARLRARGAGTGAQLAVVILALAIAISSRALYYGHPEELLGAALCVLCVLAAADGRVTWAGVLLGLALATKQWALLAVLPALLATSGGRVRLACTAGVVALVLSAPALIGSFGHFVHVQQRATLTTSQLRPENVWWPMVTPRENRIFDGVVTRVVQERYLPESLVRVPHPLIVALAVPLSLLLLWRRRGRALGADALGLLALLLLLRCMLDPINNVYYHVPFLLSLLACNTVGGRGAPLLTLLAGACVWLSFERAVVFDPAHRNLLYLAWTIALAGFLVHGLFWARKARPSAELARGAENLARA
jgi:hypothetical protein